MATATDAILTFNLQADPKQIIVEDAIDYGALGWDINDVVCVITFTGPQGVIYENTDYNNPDIVPATSRFLNKTIALPLDPETEYDEVLHGNYTLKVTWYNSVLDETEVFLETYSFTFNEPVIENTTVSGPYSGTLTSTDDTDYGDNIFLLTREHRIKYPTQLPGPPADIVSSLAQVVVDPIYTNQWTIVITSTVEYRNPDLLRILWSDSETFYHCVYGSCIDAMADVIDAALQIYIDDTPAQAFNQESYQKRLVTINAAWHLLNIAYQNGDVDEADKQSYIIQQAIQWTGSGTCGGTTSELVIPCPPYTGGTGPGVDYEFTNGITEAGGVPPQVKLGGTLIENTTINIVGYVHTISGTNLGNVVSQSISAANGVEVSHSDSSTEGKVIANYDKVTLERTDLATPANTRIYEVTSAGLVEKADYTSGYTARTLVAKSYVDDNFLLKTDGSFNTFTEKVTPVDGDIILIEDSEAGYVKKKIQISSLSGQVGVSTFLDLTDTISSYAGLADYALLVAGTEDSVVAYDLTQTYFHTTTAGQIEGLTNKGTPVGADKILIEDSADSWNKKEINLADIPVASTTFISQSDTPGSYVGFGGYFVRVNVGETALEFISGTWVPVSGGTFTGQVTFATTGDRQIVLQKVGSGGTPSVPQGGINLISFQDGDGDEQGYIGIDGSGNVVLKTFVSGGEIYSDGNFDVNGNITVSGTVDGVDIAAFKADYDVHTHDFATEITGKPTTLAGYGITDAITTITADFANQFTEKLAAVIGDRIVIEDSADSYAKKYLQIGNLPTSALTFLSLTDVPSTYSGQGDYLVRVKTAEDGLEFFDADGLWISTTAGTLDALTEKVNPVSSDILIIEDAADSFTQKKILIGSLPSSGATGSGVTSIEHRYITDTTDTDPGNGYFKFDNATFSSVTNIYIDNLNWWAVNVRTTLLTLKEDDYLYIQQVGASDRALVYQLTGAIVTTDAGYLKIPVSYVSGTVSAIQGNNNCGFITHYNCKDLTFSQSIVETSGTVTLVGDVASPTAVQYYGTNNSSTRGWYDLLGETSVTAYRGDRGKTAYDHSQLVTGNPHSLDLADIGESYASINYWTLSGVDVYYNGGNVGIGTSSPDAKLEIVGDVHISNNLLNIEGSAPRIRLTEDGQSNAWTIIQDSNKFQIREDYTANTRLTIDDGGNVGIGTTSPDGKLHVSVSDTGATAGVNYDTLIVEENAANMGISLLARNNQNAGIAFGDADDSTEGLIIYGNANDEFSFYTNSTIAMTIDSSQNVGIGTTTPRLSTFTERALTVQNSGTGQTAIEIVGSQNTDTYVSGLSFHHTGSSEASKRIAQIAAYREGEDSTASLRFFTGNAGIFTQHMIIDEDGGVGIGTNSPVTTLDVNGVITATGGNSTEWNTAYTERAQWDGGSTNLVPATGRVSLGLVIGTDVQAYDGDLSAIAALVGTTGLLRKTAAETWSLDTSAYLTEVIESNLNFSDITTANATASQHGLLPKLSGATDEFLRGDGSWQVPSKGSFVVSETKTLSGNTLLSTSIPAGHKLVNVLIYNGTSNPALIEIGTTSGGNDIVTSLGLTTNGYTECTLDEINDYFNNGKFYSATAAQSIYVADDYDNQYTFYFTFQQVK